MLKIGQYGEDMEKGLQFTVIGSPCRPTQTIDRSLCHCHTRCQ